MRRIKIGLIGCGMIVERAHIKAFEEIMKRDADLFRVAALCDLKEDNARRIANYISQFQKDITPKIYTDYEKMLEIEDLDAVSVATPHFIHAKPTIEALEKGVNVVIEKPFSITIKAGRKMIEASKRSGKILACIEPRRRSVRSRLIDWIINKEKIIGKARFHVYHEVEPEKRFSLIVGTPWRHDKYMAGGGWALDGLVHYFDFLRMIFGDALEVYAKVKNFEPIRFLDYIEGKGGSKTKPVRSNVEDSVFSILTFESGVISSITWSSATHGEWSLMRGYYGEQGSLVLMGLPEVKAKTGFPEETGFLTWESGKESIENLEKHFMESLDEEEKSRFFPLGMTNPYAIAYYDFFDSILTKRQPEITGEDALAAQAIAEAMYESSIVGEPVCVKDIIEGKISVYQREIDEMLENTSFTRLLEGYFKG